ncbi:hypothetical protein BCR43DRAFT_381852 [Syncephalastrum racemosum]|uniref:Uncharacterized protein n=1 Tax=Syncephalastrum racemosum TaxID=13706 RepID=A0A1X2H5A0_SYNRA|nr:hypothetical protein BCR43DRAFT_381852 [Syncephalastrum racemosum]
MTANYKGRSAKPVLSYSNKNGHSHARARPSKENYAENMQSLCEDEAHSDAAKSSPKGDTPLEKYERSNDSRTPVNAANTPCSKNASSAPRTDLNHPFLETLAALEDDHDQNLGQKNKADDPPAALSDARLSVKQKNIAKSTVTSSRTCLSGPSRLANRLPRGFVKDEADPMRYFFAGFYTGDGCHDATSPGFIIRRKACEFVSLYNLLHRCGVRRPNFKFYKNERSIHKCNAGYTGFVAWGYRSQDENSSILVDQGLPSTQMNSTDSELLKSFLPSDISKQDKQQFFMLFLLGYIMANGHIQWRYGGNTKNPRIRYTGVALCPSDAGFMNWLSENLAFVGFDSFRMDIRNQTKSSRATDAKRYFLYIHKTAKNNHTLLRGIQLLEKHTIPLEGKLQILKHFLECDGRLPTTFISAREISFHKYIESVKDDRSACVIAQ